MRCWNCGFDNLAGAKFCANCGKPQRPPCPECGAEIPEGARFCPNCGIALADSWMVAGGRSEPSGPVLTAEARKVVTILFTDLVGSTGLTEKLDPEDARAVVQKFYEMVEHAITRWYEGTVANLLGDAVLAVFGLPVSHEDDPERAVRAGLAIRDAMPVLNAHLKAAYAVELAVRVGINTGEVVAASGSTFERDFLVSDAVTVAARLQQTVDPGTVVVGERTHRLTRDAIQYRELPPMEVKGKQAPLRVWQALTPLPERVDVRRAIAPLVGRHAELGLLQHHYQRSRDDQVVQLVTVFGQPGVGKSRLLREFLAEVRETAPAPLMLRGRSVAFGGQVGYHALIDILRSQGELLDTDTPQAVREKLDRWLHDVLPHPPDVLDDLLLVFNTPDTAAMDPSVLRGRLFDAWHALVTGLASDRPVILVMEDLHWADDGVLDLVELLTRSVEPIALLVICLARPDLLERRPTWGGGRRNAVGLDLAPLRPLETEQLVASLSSEALAPELRQAVAQRAEGNPLFAEELVRMLLEGSMPGAAIPDTIQAVLTARIDRLPPDERKVLQAASVMGRAFWPSVVAPIAGLTESDVNGVLGQLVGKELILSRPRSPVAGETEYAFRHILTRDVAYSLLPKSSRQRAHLEAAAWLMSRFAGRDEEIVEILAEHFRLGGDDAQAAGYLRRAAVKARRLYANTDALRLSDEALAAAERAGVPPGERARIYRDRGEVHQLLGHYAAALDDFNNGLVFSQQAADRRLEGILENRIGLIHHREARFDDAAARFAKAADLAREAGDDLTLGQSLVDLANIDWDRKIMRPDHPALVEGLTFLRAAADQSSLARALNLLAMSHVGEGNGAAAISAAEEALAAARAAGDKSKEATSLSYLSRIHGFHDNYEEAIRYGNEAARLADEIGDRRRKAYCLTFVGEPSVALGRWGEAITLLEAALPLVREVAKVQIPWPHMYLGLVYLHLGAVDRAQDVFRGGMEAPAQFHAGWPPIAAVCRMHYGRLIGSEAEVHHGRDRILRFPRGTFVPADGEVLIGGGDILVDACAPEDLRKLIEESRPGIERLGSHAHVAALRAVEAGRAEKEGDIESALTLLEQARELAQSCGNVLIEWHAREARLRIRADEEDRAGLLALFAKIGASLPDDLKTVFEANPRVAIVL
ncbi:MAG TPA: tetratricopeptide repeat protein [bacterium]|nr:tetratricopeptide repeat protein [bacterium]